MPKNPCIAQSIDVYEFLPAMRSCPCEDFRGFHSNPAQQSDPQDR